MKQIYAVLLSSVLSAGCSPAVTKTSTVPEQDEMTLMKNLATATYQKVDAMPDRIFPEYLGDYTQAVNYGKFRWFIKTHETELVYITRHNSLPVLVAMNDWDHDGSVNRAVECDMPHALSCKDYDLQTAQFLYGKMLRDTSAAIDGKMVAADKEFASAYISALSESSREELRKLNELE